MSAVQIKVPVLGESVSSATIAKWLKKEGDAIAVDEPIVELETDKVTMEVNAPSAGVLAKIIVKEGDTVDVGALLGEISNDGKAAATASSPTPAPANTGGAMDLADPAAAPSPMPAAPQAAEDTKGAHKPSDAGEPQAGPAARKALADKGLSTADVSGTGKDGRVTKDDVAKAGSAPAAPAAAPAPKAPAAPRKTTEREERVRMTKLRQTIAGRLKEAQNTAAILTTFNEVDMTAVMELRNQFKDGFEKKHGVKLGFMSFFAKAAVQALKEFPAVNAEIDGTDIIYKNYYDIGVAVSTPQGLVVPVVRDCDQLSFAGIEQAIGDYGKKAKDGKIAIEDMQGGTFTITNGGVFGSLVSTPILNAPQSAILGMHATQQRAMVMPDGSIQARPMMYLALSYDHRIVDGREAVSFLVRIKQVLENPARLLLEA